LGGSLSRPTLARVRGSNPLPEGTLEVGVGLAIAGVTAYGFTVVAARALGPTDYAPLSVLWAMVFVAGPGFFLPIEQEVSRALAARRARGVGTGPVIRRAALFGALIALLLFVAMLVLSPILVSHLFSGDWLLFVGLVLGMLGYCVEHLARGTYSGLGRFRPYSVVVGGEALLRFLACVLLAVAGVGYAGWYGLALGVAPVVAVIISMRGQHGMVTEGPDAPWSELSGALGALLIGSVLAMVLVNGGPIAMQILAGDDQQELVSQFFTAVIIARIPLFLFQAVQAALLPKLSALASAGKFDEFRIGFRKLVTVVAGVGSVAVVAAFLIGPWAISLLYGPEFDLTHRTVGLLAAGSVLFMLAQAMAQAVIALGGHTKMALCWLAAVATFVIVTAAGTDLYLRVEVGLLAGCAVACLGMAALVRQLVRSGAKVHTGDLIEAIHDVSVEP
jgi:O-antigen/teichoic acid export membrane protein